MNTYRVPAVLLLSLLSWLPGAHAEELEAVLGWAQRTELATTISGMVAEVPARAGERVRAQQTLLRFDDREEVARLTSARAAVEQARQLKAEADQELVRNQELYDRTVLSDHDLRLAEIGAAKAAAAWQQANAERISAEVSLERTRISAPFDGVVIEVLKRPGEAVINRITATPLVVVASATQMIATSLISAERASSLVVGDEVTLQLRDKQLATKISAVAMEPQSDSLLYRLEVSFEMPLGSRLMAGEKAKLTLP